MSVSIAITVIVRPLPVAKLELAGWLAVVEVLEVVTGLATVALLNNSAGATIVLEGAMRQDNWSSAGEY